MSSEYRVSWQREGQAQKNRRLYQTLIGAERCARVQETAHDEMTWLDDEYSVGRGPRPKPIIFGPIIEEREVGPWADIAEERE